MNASAIHRERHTPRDVQFAAPSESTTILSELRGAVAAT
jgi:hypothetical protein